MQNINKYFILYIIHKTDNIKLNLADIFEIEHLIIYISLIDI